MKNGDFGNFTTIKNHIVNNKMSLGAKGLYIFLNSKPPAWEFSYKGLKSQLKISESTIRKYLKEIVDAKLLIRVAEKGKDGKFKGWDWIINPSKKDIEKLEHRDPFSLTVKIPKSVKTEIPQNGSSEISKEISNTKLSKEESEEFIIHKGEKIPRFKTTVKVPK